MSGAPRLAGIVLAGGRSSRFGTDKLAVPLDGVALLDHAIAALTPVCDELLVVVPPDGRAGRHDAVRAVADPEPFAGPLVGLLAGLRVATAPVALVVAGDMPWVDPSVLRRLAAAQEDAVGDAVLLGLAVPDEAAESVARFPLALRVGPARERAEELVAHGERRLRLLVAGLGARVLPAAAWTPLDPSGRTLRDVDRPEDLEG